MKVKITSTLLGVSALFVLAILFMTAEMSMASHHDASETTASEVKEEAMEALEVFKKFTIEQRDEAIDVAIQTLEKLDRRIDYLQRDIDDKWENMSKITQENTRKTLNELRKKREDLAEWLGGIRYGSKEAWQDVKKGFADSYVTCREPSKMQAKIFLRITRNDFPHLIFQKK